MTIHDIIIATVITILPFGLLVPDTDIKCGDVGGVYVNEEGKESKIYVCTGDQFTSFYKFHEIGHKIWNEYLTQQQKSQYIKLYNKSRFHLQDDVEEDFCDVFAHLQLNQKQNINVQIRTKFIRNLIIQ